MLRPTLILCVALAPGLSGAAERTPLTPGTGAGGTRLGGAQADVRKQLGKPARSFPTHGGCSADTWRTDGEEVEVVYRSGRAVQIKVTSERFRTRNGLSTASPFAQIRRLHPHLKRTMYLYDMETGKGLDYYDDVRQGIAFVFPGPTATERDNDHPSALIVHRVGQPAIPTEIKDPSNTATPAPAKK